MEEHVREGYQYIGFPTFTAKTPAGTEILGGIDRSEFVPGIDALNSKEVLGGEYDKVITILPSTIIQNMGKYDDKYNQINYLSCVYVNITRAISNLCLIISA